MLDGKRRKPRNRRRSYGGRVVEIVSTRGDSLDAVVVENKREGGKVRQRVICHLGVVHENTKNLPRDRYLFWKYSAPKLERLDLKREERTRLEAQLSKVIPKMSTREFEQYEAEGQARYQQLMSRARD